MNPPTINLIARTPFEKDSHGRMKRIVLERYDSDDDTFEWGVHSESVNECNHVLYRGPDRSVALGFWWRACNELYRQFQKDQS